MNEIFVVDVSMSSKAKRETKPLLSSHKCLECKKAESKKRGLCIHCYNAFYNIWRLKTENAKAVFEARLIRIGKLLAPRDKSRAAPKNTFERVDRR